MRFSFSGAASLSAALVLTGCDVCIDTCMQYPTVCTPDVQADVHCDMERGVCSNIFYTSGSTIAFYPATFAIPPKQAVRCVLPLASAGRSNWGGTIMDTNLEMIYARRRLENDDLSLYEVDVLRAELQSQQDLIDYLIPQGDVARRQYKRLIDLCQVREELHLRKATFDTMDTYTYRTIVSEMSAIAAATGKPPLGRAPGPVDDYFDEPKPREST